MKTPDVSLSNLCTEYGLLSLNILLLENISIKFFFDFVPPWTAIPDSLFTTIKFSLSSIIKSSFSLMISFVGLNFIFFCIIFSLKLTS